MLLHNKRPDTVTAEHKETGISQGMLCAHKRARRAQVVRACKFNWRT